MFSNVLVGVDGRAGGRDAIALAGKLLAEDGQITLAHVHGGENSHRHSVQAVVPNADEDSIEMLRRERDAEGVAAELLSFTSSSAGRGLHTLAEQRNADLIVVGSCSRTTIGRAMLGDDTRAALNGAPCAVAIAVCGYAEHPVPIATIGVGYDDSPESERALAAARAVAQHNRSLVRALHVVTLPAYALSGMAGSAVGESIDALLQGARRELAQLEGVEGRAVYGLPGEELAAFGKEVDLLVVGSRSYGPVKRLMLGSTSNRLQREAQCSLLVLPRSAVSMTSNLSHAEDSAFPQPATAPER